MQIGNVYFCQQSTSPNVCARKRFIPQEAINISIPGADENWVCYRPGEMTRLAECNCRLLVPLTPARLIVLHDERSNIFYYVQLGTCDFMVILGSLMLLQIFPAASLRGFLCSPIRPLFISSSKAKTNGEKNQQSTFFHVRCYYVLFPPKFAYVVVCTWNTPMLHCVYPKLPQEPGDRAKVGGDNSHR